MCVFVSGESSQRGFVGVDRQTAPCLWPDSQYPERQKNTKDGGKKSARAGNPEEDQLMEYYKHILEYWVICNFEIVARAYFLNF